MCGRYLVLTEDDYEEMQSIINEVSEKYKESNLVNGEVFPTNTIPVVYSHNGKNILSAAKWGFPNFQNSGVIINARAESVAEKPMFRKSFATKRCLLPANAYFEWLTHEDKKKTKYLINIKEKHLFFMAGIYNMFTDKDGIVYPATTIITTEASHDISFIHNRMPVILQPQSINTWLDSNADQHFLQSLLIPFPGNEIDYKVAS